MNPVPSSETRQIRTPLPKDIDRLMHGDHHDPFSILGPHLIPLDEGQALTIRVFAPEAEAVNVIDLDRGTATAMSKANGMGFFTAIFPDRTSRFRYELEFINRYGQSYRTADPYAFLPILTDFDLHLFAEGNHWTIYDKLGAHLMTVEGVPGVHFAVWAPAARRVSVIGNFNNWDGRRHPMRVHLSGVWEIFIPGLRANELYKFEIKTREGHLRVKSDPYARATELRPNNAAIVTERKKHQWQDQDWMTARRETLWLDRPMSIYEVHLGSWKRKGPGENDWYGYREIAPELAAYVKDMGYTHIELMPLMEHPYDPSWGYQVTGYFAVTRRYGTPEDFAYFVDFMHRNQIGVIMDWVPAHFPKDDWALRWFDGTALYEHLDPRQGEHPDWGTLIFNYGRNEVRNFLIGSALFWLDEYHIDGLRVDAVASMLYLDYSRQEGQWLPNKFGGRENLEAIDFIKKLNEVVHDRFPGAITIAEESTAWPMVSRPTYLGGLGFTFKWNMGWMNDFLRYMREDPIHRKYHQNLITFSMYYAFTENFILPLSHDEVVHGKRSLLDKMPGDLWQKLANFRVALGYMYGHPGKKLTFMGSEFGQWWEWNHADALQWHLLDNEHHRQLQRFVRDLNALYCREPAFYEVDFSWEGFQWIDFQDFDASLISFLRRGRNPEDVLVLACNFTPVTRPNYRIGVPFLTSYQELLNSDSELYGGSNVGNAGWVHAEPRPHHNQPYSMEITFPPLAVLVFKARREQPE